MSRSVSVRVPATVGNFGGAANCGAVALESSLNLKVTLREDAHLGIRYFGEDGERVPRDGSNLVVRAMESAIATKAVAFPGADFEIYSSVPVGVGFGSSAAATLAGLIAADRLFRLGLDEKTIFELAAFHEPRAESVRAAWFGGFAACHNGEPHAPHQPTTLRDFILNAVIPAASGKDVPGLGEALDVRMSGATIFLCGSGPAVGITANAEAAEAVAAVRQAFACHGVPTTTGEYRPTNTGARDWNARAQAAAAGISGVARKPTLIPV